MRAYLLAEVARLFGTSGNRERAKAVLAEARQLAGKSPDRPTEMLSYATIAVEIEPAYGFRLTQEAIEAINTSGNTREAGYSRNEDRKYDFTYRHDFDGNLGALARVDFDRAFELARRIKPKEVALLAELAICKGVLAKPTPPTGAAHHSDVKK
jgi:hypothetical protein